jgi:hypothetical protein
MINWIQQPEGSSLCGQTCVAMIAGITLEESIEVFGKRSATRTKDLVAALRKLGIDCGDPPLTRIKGTMLTRTCIVKLHFDYQTHTHWTLWHNGQFYDPDFTGQYTLNCYKGKYPKGVRQTSYLPIFIQ